jgi:hypothetical protein
MASDRRVSCWPSALSDEFAASEEAGALDAVRLAGVTVSADVLSSPMPEDPGVELGEAVRQAVSGRVQARKRALAEVSGHRTVAPSQRDQDAPVLAIREALAGDLLVSFQRSLEAWSRGEKGSRKRALRLAGEVRALLTVIE